jgi:hypothetical protein
LQVLDLPFHREDEICQRTNFFTRGLLAAVDVLGRTEVDCDIGLHGRHGILQAIDPRHDVALALLERPLALLERPLALLERPLALLEPRQSRQDRINIVANVPNLLFRV